MMLQRFMRCMMVCGLTVVLALGITSCKSSRKTLRPSVSRTVSNPPVAKGDNRVNHSNLAAPLKSLFEEADKWLGVPYRYGGNDKNGVDCSGFVTQVFKNALNFKLPRVSAQQYEYCAKVMPSELEPGDLVFYHSPGSFRVTHVGLYAGGNLMIHASSSQGVMYASIEQPYFVNNYVGAGRVAQLRKLIDKEEVLAKKQKPADVAEPKVKPVSREIEGECVEILEEFFD